MSLRPYVPTRRRIGAAAAVCSLLVSGLLTGASAAPAAIAGAPTDAVAAAACAANAHERVRPGATIRDPNTASPSEVAAAGVQLAGKQRRMTSLDRVKIVRPTSKIVIKVYARVITKASKDGNGRYLGWVPSSRIVNQINVLNAAYASSGFTFVLATAPASNLADPWPASTANNDWYSWSEEGDDDDLKAKTALHQGSVADLNLYFAALEDGLLGYATFPWEKAGSRDGVVLLNDSLPGGAGSPYNLGDTAVHEVGHWLGLFHTFQGSCEYVNDAVSDTPAQADGDNVFGCNTADDTCSRPGTDPVRNYMSYGTDACLTNFTSGQGLRMRQSWYSFRVPTA